MVGERQIDHAYYARKEGLYLERENGKRGDNRGNWPLRTKLAEQKKELERQRHREINSEREGQIEREEGKGSTKV